MENVNYETLNASYVYINKDNVIQNFNDIYQKTRNNIYDNKKLESENLPLSSLTAEFVEPQLSVSFPTKNYKDIKVECNKGKLYFDFESDVNSLQYKLYSLGGNLLKVSDISIDNKSIDFQYFRSGVYLLILYRDYIEICSCKINRL